MDAHELVCGDEDESEDEGLTEETNPVLDLEMPMLLDADATSEERGADEAIGTELDCTGILDEAGRPLDTDDGPTLLAAADDGLALLGTADEGTTADEPTLGRTEEAPPPAAQANWTLLSCQPAVLAEKPDHTIPTIAFAFAPDQLVNGIVTICAVEVTPVTAKYLLVYALPLAVQDVLVCSSNVKEPLAGALTLNERALYPFEEAVWHGNDS